MERPSSILINRLY